MFKIGDFAKLNRVTVKTLRHYDSIGLLQPEKIDSLTGYRYYSASQMPQLNHILSLKDMGFSLEEVSLILDKAMDSDQLHVLLELKHIEIKEKIKAERIKLSRIETFIKMNKQEGYTMNYNVVIKSIEPIKVASLRDFIQSYGDQGHLWDELGKYINLHNGKIVPPCMVIYHDPGYKEDTVDAEVIEPIVSEIPSSDRIKVKNLEGFSEMACVVHKGSYETLHLAYNVISTWIQENGYMICGPQRELYLKGEWITDDPDEYITEIQFPVSKIG